MDPKEIDRQLEDMWQKVSGRKYVPDAPSLPSDIGSANLDTLKLLKDNFSKADGEWRRLLEMKDSNLRELNARLEETKTHLAELRQHYHLAGEKLMNEELSAALNLEESKKTLATQKKNHAREITLLKEILERTKSEMISLGERVEALRRERDDWQKKFSEHSVFEADLKDKAAGLEHKLGDAKEAVQRTLSELLAERKNHQDSENKIKALEKNAKELSAGLEAAKTNWDAERAQWRELWDRERSVWETHRQEFAVWEERLRSEREAWTARMREEENKGVQAASGLTTLLKDTSEWSEKVTQILKLYALKGVQLPQTFVLSSVSANRAPKKIFTSMAAAILAAVLIMTPLAWWLRNFRTQVHLKPVGGYALDVDNPSGLAGSKVGLWVADWNRGLLLKDRGDLSTLRILNGAEDGPFRPAALAAAADGLWVLDMAQLRFVKKSFKDGTTLEIVKTPGPAPQAPAYDGYNLWSFDAASGLLYKYSLDPKAGVTASFELKDLKNLLAMQWCGGELWTLDSKSRLRRYSLKDGVFSIVSNQQLKKPALTFWADGSAVFWTVEKAGTSAGYELQKYAVKIY
ncbi:MAG TPA: hypothetical protein DCL44_03180 [Elusimicrobia bacterium]|nr:hypothetical protein [Elusimicrobiota bacterium]